MGAFGEMTVVSPQWIGTLALLAVVGWLRFFRVGRYHFVRSPVGAPAALRIGPRRRFRRPTVLVLAAVLTVATVASGVNAYFSYLPKVRDLVDLVTSSPPPEAAAALAASTVAAHPSGELVRLEVPDRGSGFGTSAALVWLPPQYFDQPATRFPVVYLFHGSPGVPKDWFRGGEADRIGLALARRDAPAILVAPRMSKSWLDDPECVDGRHEKIETHLLLDVIPSVDAGLRTIADRSARVFAGMSAGGYCALNLGLRDRRLVATILDLSGYTRPTHSGGLKGLFGQAGSRAAAANTPSMYAPSLSGTPQTRVWLDAGSGDKAVLKEMKELQPVLAQRGVSVQLHTRPGQHTFSVWRPALAQSMQWALAEVARTHASLPGR